jgi:hypothetical protein
LTRIGPENASLSDTPILNARAEVYRDNNAALVLTFPANNDFVNAELGLPNSSRAAPSPTTYGEITWASPTSQQCHHQ